MTDERPPRRFDDSGGFAQQARAWAVALNVVYYLLAAGLMGYVIDATAQTWPRWTIVLGVVGLVVGIYRFVREALQIMQQGSSGRTRPSDRGAPPDADD